MNQKDVDYIAKGIRELVEKNHDRPDALETLRHTVLGHIKFFHMEGITFDRHKFFTDCGFKTLTIKL